jgi:CubicO group peptidase (beta-lactamase class C family)
MSKSRRFALAASALGAVVATAALSWRLLHSPPTAVDVGQQLQQVVSDTVANDPSVKNCVLSVMKGDGSFEWSGAAGLARQSPPTPMTQDTPIYIASITKLYTATVVMLLYEKGALSLDDPMAKFLPHGLIEGIHDHGGKDYSGAITIRQLLSHRSGIADYYSERAADGKTLFELFVAEPDRSWTADQTIARARTGMRAHFAPDTKSSYSDTNFQLLGKVIEAVTGRPLHVVLEEWLFRPLRLERTWLVGHVETALPARAATAEVFKDDLDITKTRSNGAYWADGGIVSTAREMNLFLKALSEGRIIRRDSVQLMHDWHALEFPLQYGYGTMYFKFPGTMASMTGLLPLWGHSGSTGSFLYRSEGLDLYLAGTIDQTQSKLKPFLLMRRVMAGSR